MKFRVSLAVVGGDVFGGVRRRWLVKVLVLGQRLREPPSSLGLLIILHEEWS